MNVVFNSNGAGPGQPTEALYINGVLAPQQPGDTQANPFPVGHQLGNLHDVNNWLGRSNWTVDQNFAGSFNEFRIYNHAMTPAEVASSDVLCGDISCGLSAVVSLTVNTVTGQVTMKNLLNFALTFDSYQLTSTGGALSTAGWTSIDGDTAPGTGWDKSGGSDSNQLTELYLPTAGYTMPANGEISIGNAFNPAVFGTGYNGDVTFRFGLSNGAFVDGTVIYVGVPGDFNADGVVDAADYTVWRDHLGRRHSRSRTKEAFLPASSMQPTISFGNRASACQDLVQSAPCRGAYPSRAKLSFCSRPLLASPVFNCGSAIGRMLWLSSRRFRNGNFSKQRLDSR